MPDILFEESIRLNFAQSLVLGNINNIHLMDKVVLPTDDQPVIKGVVVERFGLFETAAPNFHTYYPDIKPEDLIANEADFINPVFRALSEVVVNKRYNPVDFGKNGVLKASMNKLIGQTVYANHEAAVGNEIGSVSDATWQEAYTAGNGVKVPAGINAVFKIDGKSHPNIARKLTMTPPAIHSNSVTVQFGWEQSHPKMDQNEFMNKLGTYGTDKQLIRKIAADIRFYHETSLVSHGADPYAQLLDKNGKIANPGYADGINSLSADSQQKAKTLYYFSYKDDVVKLTQEPTILKEPIILNPDTKSQLMKKEFLISLALIFGATCLFADDSDTAKFKWGDEELDEAQFTAKVTAIKAAADSATSLTGKVADLEKEVAAEKLRADNLKTEVDTLKATDPSKGNEALAALVAEVTGEYKKLKGDKADAGFITSLASMDVKALNALKADYAVSLEDKFPMSCKSCGSHEVSRNSAVAGEGGEDPNKKPVIKSNAEVMASLTAKSHDASLLHGNTTIKPTK